MRVLFVISTLQSGGAERVCAILASKFSESNDVSLVKFDEKEPFYEINGRINIINLKSGVGEKGLLGNIKKRFSKLKDLRNLIKNGKFDAVISFLDSTNLLVILSSFGLKTPIIISEHTSFNAPKKWVFKVLRRLLYPFANALSVLTHADAKHYLKFCKNVSVIYNPNFSNFSENRIDKKENLAIFVGRLVGIKNCEMFIKVAANLKHKCYKFIVAGDGLERENLQTLSHQIGADVEFIGNISDVTSLYRRAKVLVLTSKFEGLGNTLIESIGFECVRVATKTSGACELIADGTDGVLCDIDDVCGMSAVVDELLIDENKRVQMCQNAKKRLIEFDIQNIYQKWLEILALSGVKAVSNLQKSTDKTLGNTQNPPKIKAVSNKKILFVIANLANGGAERVLAALSSELVRANEIHIAVLERDFGYYKFSNSIKFHHLAPKNGEKTNKFSKIFTLRKCFKSIKPDLIISFIDWTNVICVISNFGLKFKHIATEHHANEYLKSLKFRLIRDMAYKFVDGLSVLSKSDFEYYDFVKLRVVIHNPLFLNLDTESENLNITQSVKQNIILSVGRLEIVKGYDVFFKALAKVDSKLLKGWSVQVAGVGSQEKNLKDLVRELGLNVEFLGHIKDVETLYERAKIFVLSSRSEGLSNVLIESAAFGCARISSDTIGSRELIKNGVNGVIFESENDDELARALSEILRDEKLRQSLADNAKIGISEFKMEHIMMQWHEFIDEVMR
ncbi:glycosyltransferase [Campylobacter anatolicus]|nr:glycosyltransferase [Campylobacter anatolicus]